MTSSTITLIGMEVGYLLVESLIADGPFSTVYLARGMKSGEPHALKVAKARELDGEIDTAAHLVDPFRSQALAIGEGVCTSVNPDTKILLNSQLVELKYSSSASFVSISPQIELPQSEVISMDYLGASTLRKAMDAPVSVAHLVKLARGLAAYHRRIAKMGGGAHGDIKPENIMVVPDFGFVLIDPGFFGLIDCAEGDGLKCAVTTPVYYPFLQPDDIYAFGIILWEIACKQHPLLIAKDGTKGTQSGGSQTGESIHKWVRRYENVGQYFLSPITNLRRPTSINPTITPALEAILLKALRLQLGSDGLLESGEGYASFSEFESALTKLAETGVELL